MYKGLTGSNSETQVNKVFWHETRYIHGMFYLLSSFLWPATEMAHLWCV